MLDQNNIDTIVDRDVYGSDGTKIGAARQVYVDDETGAPEWVTVRHRSVRHERVLRPARRRHRVSASSFPTQVLRQGRTEPP